MLHSQLLLLAKFVCKTAYSIIKDVFAKIYIICND